MMMVLIPWLGLDDGASTALGYAGSTRLGLGLDAGAARTLGRIDGVTMGLGLEGARPVLGPCTT
jgi:hypothetical protein